MKRTLLSLMVALEARPRPRLRGLSDTMTLSWFRKLLRKIQPSRCISMKLMIRRVVDQVRLISSLFHTQTSRCSASMSRTQPTQLQLSAAITSKHPSIRRTRLDLCHRWESISRFSSRIVTLVTGGISIPMTRNLRHTRSI